MVGCCSEGPVARFWTSAVVDLNADIAILTSADEDADADIKGFIT